MEPLDVEDYGDQPSPEASDVSPEDFPLCPIGTEHQVEIPNLATEDERRELMNSSFHGYDYPIVVGLALPITWASPSEVDKKEEEPQIKKMSVTEARVSNGDEQSQLSTVCATSSDIIKCDQTYQDPHTVVPVVNVESDSNQVNNEKLAPCPTQESLNFPIDPMMQQRETKPLNPLPYSPMALWSDLESELFLLGLYIFGKNLKLVSRFLGTKTVGDVLSYYYGKFYKRDAYKRWADCRKAKTKRCILGERIFQGSRQPELIARLKSKIPKEVHDSLIEVFKSFSDSQTTFEEFVFALKSTVGTEAFVEAVGIGKGKHDLTGFVTDQSKPSNPDLPTGKDCSSLTSEEIIELLTGNFRRSKTRSNDLFWEAVWPRLLANGWHSEQPKDVSSTKNCLVFVVPGIKKFSRSKLTKGTHYFDSVSDVLKKVTVDPVLLKLKADGIENGFPAEENGCITDMKLNQDSPSDGYQDLPKFTIIDTSLVEGEEPFKVRELRNLPADANINFVLSHHLPDMASDSSSEEKDAVDGLSDDQGDSKRFTADIKEFEMAQSGSSQNMMTANGHSSNDRDGKIDFTSTYGLKAKAERRKYLSPVSKRRKLGICSNEQSSRGAFSFSKGVDLEKEKIKQPSTSSKFTAAAAGDIFQIKTMASCSNKEKACKQKTGTKNSLTNDGSNEKISTVKPIESCSTKEKACKQKTGTRNSHTNDGSNEKMSTVKSTESCSTKEKAFKQKTGTKNSLTNDGPNEKMSMVNSIEKKPSECKEDAVPELHSKITVDETKSAEERAQVSDVIGLNKQEASDTDKASVSMRITSSENHSSMDVDAAPSISDRNKANDPSEETEKIRPAIPQPEAANSRRHGTRNRPPTAKALEALAFGLLGSGKRKGDPKNTVNNRPSQRARKATKGSGSMAASDDTEKSMGATKGSGSTAASGEAEKSSVNAEAQQ